MLEGRLKPKPLIVFTLLALVALIGGAAGYFSAGSARTTAPTAAAESQPRLLRGVVQATTADSLTLSTDTGPVTLKLAPNALRGTTAGDAVGSSRRRLAEPRRRG